MHPDQVGYMSELHCYFRQVLVDKLSVTQLQLHDYYSSIDPLHDPDESSESEEYEVDECLI